MSDADFGSIRFIQPQSLLASVMPTGVTEVESEEPPAGTVKSIIPCTPLAIVKCLEYVGVYNRILPYGDRAYGKIVTVINRCVCDCYSVYFYSSELFLPRLHQFWGRRTAPRSSFSQWRCTRVVRRYWLDPSSFLAHCLVSRIKSDFRNIPSVPECLPVLTVQLLRNAIILITQSIPQAWPWSSALASLMLSSLLSQALLTKWRLNGWRMVAFAWTLLPTRTLRKMLEIRYFH